jgi:hypothetical protein
MVPNLTIIPICKRDLVAAAREREGRRLHAEHCWFGGMLLAFLIGTIGASYYWSDGYFTHQAMTRGVNEAAGCGVINPISGPDMMGAWPAGNHHHANPTARSTSLRPRSATTRCFTPNMG